MKIIEHKTEEVEAEKESINFNALIYDNRTIIYSVLFYVAGLIFGAFIYAKFNGDALNSLILSGISDKFLQQLVNDLARYYLIFAITVLLGICLIGFPVINIIPLLLGFETAVRVTYYYFNYGMRGLGYTLLMIAPFSCVLLTVIILSIEKSFALSKTIYNITVKKQFDEQGISYKSYFKSYLLYGILIGLSALADATATTSLGGIITL